jgi:hypothetical protein
MSGGDERAWLALKRIHSVGLCHLRNFHRQVAQVDSLRVIDL